MMDVSYSAWHNSTEESLVLRGESFSFLFDRRYTNRLNRMSRVFFEAYAKATKELSAQEDRFPSLSEIDAKMESGAVYAFKDRLTKNTEFFEEIKISGVSYLVPRALRFIDASGLYSDLIFNFEDGTVVLPTRRKVPSPPGFTDEEINIKEEIPKPVVPSPLPSLPPSSELPIVQKVEEITPKQPQAQPQAAPQAASQAPPDDARKETISAHIPEPYGEIEDVHETAPKSAPLPAEPKKPVEPKKKESLSAAPPGSPFGNRRTKLAIAGLVVLIALVSAGAYLIAGSAPPAAPKVVDYSAYISNATNDTYLGLDITNPDAVSTELEMILPINIDRSISSRGGVVTISHTGSTFIRLNSSSDDAGVKVYLSDNKTSVPVILNLVVPANYESSLQVQAKDYDVKRKDDRIVLRFNCTTEVVTFEQSYTKKG